MIAKALTWLYVAGYLAHIGLAAVSAWGTMTFLQWWGYMAAQVALYGPTWPLWAALYAFKVI